MNKTWNFDGVEISARVWDRNIVRLWLTTLQDSDLWDYVMDTAENIEFGLMAYPEYLDFAQTYVIESPMSEELVILPVAGEFTDDQLVMVEGFIEEFIPRELREALDYYALNLEDADDE